MNLAEQAAVAGLVEALTKIATGDIVLPENWNAAWVVNEHQGIANRALAKFKEDK